MIFITGDTHGLIDFYKLQDYFSKVKTTREDYLLILGDVGLLWSEEIDYRKEYSSLGPTVLYLDGNHENFDILKRIKVSE